MEFGHKKKFVKLDYLISGVFLDWTFFNFLAFCVMFTNFWKYLFTFTGVKMSMRGRFFTRAEYQQFVYYALVDVRGKIKTLPPCIIKPSALWSGKQIISTIIINLVPEVRCLGNLFFRKLWIFFIMTRELS